MPPIVVSIANKGHVVSSVCVMWCKTAARSYNYRFCDLSAVDPALGTFVT